MSGGEVRRQLHHALVVARVDVLGVAVAIDFLELGADRLDVLAGDVLAALMDAVEHLLDLVAEAASGPAEVGLEDLADVHSRRHAQRIQHHVGMSPVLEERHVLDRQDAADDALVAVTAGHLVARLQLALHGDEDLDHLEHARRQLVTGLELADTVLEAVLDRIHGLVILALQGFEVGLALVVLDRDLPPFVALRTFEGRLIQGRALLDGLRRGRRDLALISISFRREKVARLRIRTLVVGVLLEPLLLFRLDRPRAVIDVDSVTVEDADLDDGAADARRQSERRVADVRSLLAEDGAEQLLLRGHRAFALRRDLAAQDVARLDLGADVDDAGLVEVAKRFLADVRNVTSDVLGPELGVAGHDLEFLDVDRGEDVVLHDPLGDQDRILVIVPVPRHERDEHVPAERQLAVLGRRPVGDDLARFDRIADLHQRTLIDAGVLVRALELHQRVDVDPGFAGLEVARGANHDAGGVDLVDHARPPSRDRGAQIARDRFFHAGADERRLRAQ